MSPVLKPGTAWVKALENVDQVEFDLDEAISTLREQIDERLVEACTEEQERCLDWVTSGLLVAEVVDGIKSGEYAPGSATEAALKAAAEEALL